MATPARRPSPAAAATPVPEVDASLDSAEAPYIRVIGKAAAALEILLDEDRDLTLSELARRLDMSRSTVHRLLATLERHRFVDRTEAGAYRLGLQLFRLGSAVRVNAVLGRVAQPELELLANGLNLSAYLSVRDRDRAICVVRVDAGPVMATIYQVGDTLPLNLGAGPRILLSDLPDAEIERILEVPLPTMTESTVARPDRVRALVREIRDTGLSFAADDIEVGLAAMGVPVRDEAGGVIAAISVLALTDWFRDERRTVIETALRGAAVRIESRLQA